MTQMPQSIRSQSEAIVRCREVCKPLNLWIDPKGHPEPNKAGFSFCEAKSRCDRIDTSITNICLSLCEVTEACGPILRRANQRLKSSAKMLDV